MDAKSAIDKIKALMGKTIEAGCTEAEAMQAALMAAKLMDKYGVTPEQLLTGAAAVEEQEVKMRRVDHPSGYVTRAVAAFTNTRIYTTTETEAKVNCNLFGEETIRSEARKLYKVIGLPHDIEVARYILDICAGAMDRMSALALVAHRADCQSKRIKLSSYDEATWVFDFCRGMAKSMNATLQQMTLERDGAPDAIKAGDGRSLVAIKHSLVEAWMREQGLVLRSSSSPGVRNKSAAEQGRDAGRNVRFNTGVASGGSLAIGRC